MVYGAVLGTEGISHSAGVALRYAAAVDYVDGDAAETLKTASDNVVERFLWLYTGLTVKDEHTGLVEECQMLAEKKQKHHGEIPKLYNEMKQASPSIKLKKRKNHSKLDNAIANLVANTPNDESRGDCPDNVVKLLLASSEGMAFAEQVKVTREIATQQRYLTAQTHTFSAWKAELAKMDDEIVEV
jgi:hypothetical protein